MDESEVAIKWGKRFRQAWIDAVQRHGPDDVKPSWTAPWNQMPQWERQAAIRAHSNLRALHNVYGSPLLRQLPEWTQGFILTTLWNDAVLALATDPKPGWATPWMGLEHWRQEVNIDIFRALTSGEATGGT